MRHSSGFRRSILAAATALACVALPAAAQDVDSPFSQTIFFGDSLTDAGFFQPMLPANVQAVTGKFTTNPNYIWAQFLAEQYGTSGEVAWQQTPTSATPAMRSGTNWAIGGARIATGATSLKSQYQAYLASGHTVDPNALYAVWGGGNDLRDAAAAAQSNPAAAPGIIGGAVTGLVGIVGDLQARGAQYILVPSAPDLGLTPEAGAGGAAGRAGATALAASFNNALYSSLASANLRVIPMDTFHFIQEVVANPSAYGLVNATGTACAQATWYQPICNPTSVVPGGAETYLFADPIHPTSATHRMLGQFAASLIDGPRSIAVLPRSEASVGRARAQMVDGALAGFGDEDGMRWWANVRGDQQRYNDSIGFDGVGPTASFGIGWRSGGLVYGGFAGYGRQDIDFGLRRGEFKQTDASLGGFIGWRGDAFWANAQASWTQVGYEVDRIVRLGAATRVHSGSPDGDNLSAGASAGWNFNRGALTHGPVVSVLSQRISVDGYAENSTESTALAYPEQDYDSLVGSAGWQVSYALNDHLSPYARLTWDREFEDAPAQAWAQSRSLPGTLPYAVPGLAFDDSYGTAIFGVRTELFGLDANAGASLTVGQKGGDDATFFLSLGNKF